MKTPIERFSRLPSSLASRAKTATLGDVPALLAHPDWEAPAPLVLWMHGRTVSKELDPGRYLRWVRAGIAACAVDLPGHGERFDRELQQPENTLFVVKQMIGEIDGVIGSLLGGDFGRVFDAERLAIGGMSAGGMATLRRTADDHPFKAIAVESTAGDFSKMPSYVGRYEQDLIDELDPMRRVEGRPATPLLALHSEKDEWVPVGAIRGFVEALRPAHEAAGAELTLRTWPETGAPYEHAGFGKVAAGSEGRAGGVPRAASARVSVRRRRAARRPGRGPSCRRGSRPR